MRSLAGLVKFAWEFIVGIVGDDSVTAVGVVFALGITALLADQEAAWLVMPAAVAALLAISIWRAARPKP
jgi:hypothetical protein